MGRKTKYEKSPYLEVGLVSGYSRRGKRSMGHEIVPLYKDLEKIRRDFKRPHLWDISSHRMKAICRRCRKPRFSVESRPCNALQAIWT